VPCNISARRIGESAFLYTSIYFCHEHGAKDVYCMFETIIAECKVDSESAFLGAKQIPIAFVIHGCCQHAAGLTSFVGRRCKSGKGV
jgi:hypothetical protein